MYFKGEKQHLDKAEKNFVEQSPENHVAMQMVSSVPADDLFDTFNMLTLAVQEDLKLNTDEDIEVRTETVQEGACVDKYVPVTQKRIRNLEERTDGPKDV